MKRGLQIVMAVLSLIPLGFGLLNMTGGAARFMDPEHVTAAIDSQFRFQSAYYLGLFALIWWIIPNVERHTAVFRIVIGALFLGGLARVYSYMTVGPPPPNMVAGIVIELTLPLLIIWQARLKK